MYINLIQVADLLVIMLEIAGGFLLFAALLTAPHALLSGLLWGLKRLGKKRRIRRRS